MPQPTKLGKITFSSVSLQEQLQLDRMQSAINTLGGYNGPIELQNHLDLGGHKISNVAAAEGPQDVVTSEVAEKNYSATALRSQIEAGGSVPLRTYVTGLKGGVTATGPGVAQAAVQSVENFTQVGGNLALSQLPTAGLSVTITTAKLTPTGSNGSMTFTNGLLTAQTPAT
jgi:hypothetical protein